MRTALVGFTASSLDAYIAASLLAHLKVNPGRLVLDAIDLRNGRDFLRETQTYDVVCLFMIFRYREDELEEWERRSDVYGPEARVSPLHTPGRWRERLAATGARCIYVVGYEEFSEVCPEWLGNVPGYRMTRLNKSDAVYEKE